MQVRSRIARRRHARHYERVLRAAKERYKEGGEGVLQGLGLYDLEREPRWLERARGLADAMLERFWDPAGGGTSDGAGTWLEVEIDPTRPVDEGDLHWNRADERAIRRIERECGLSCDDIKDVMQRIRTGDFEAKRAKTEMVEANVRAMRRAAKEVQEG